MNDDIWAKLIYFEQNRRLAKAYVSTPALSIDGSTSGLDGFRIGLSGIENQYRDLNSMSCLRSIGLGVKLKIDSHGNILIRKIGPQNQSKALANLPSTADGAPMAHNNNRNLCSIWVKGWPPISTPDTINDNLASTGEQDHMLQEIKETDVTYKLFDMRRFRLQLERERRLRRRVRQLSPMDWRRCISIISFVRNKPTDGLDGAPGVENLSRRGSADSGNMLNDPCWLMLINIIAIDMLKSSLCDNDLNPRFKQQSYEQQTSFDLLRERSLLASGSASNRRSGSHEEDIADRFGGRDGAGSQVSSSTSAMRAARRGGSHLDLVDENKGLDQHVDYRERSVNNRTRLRQADSFEEFNNGYSDRREALQDITRQSNITSSAASASNAIYTTFNGRYFDPEFHFTRSAAMQSDQSSTSDFTSSSRSSGNQSSNYMQNYYNQLITNQRHSRQRFRRLDAARIDSYDESTLAKDTNPIGQRIDIAKFAGRSLSSLDLGRGSGGVVGLGDSRRVPSAIKMNYDSFDDGRGRGMSRTGVRLSSDYYYQQRFHSGRTLDDRKKVHSNSQLQDWSNRLRQKSQSVDSEFVGMNMHAISKPMSGNLRSNKLLTSQTIQEIDTHQSTSSGKASSEPTTTTQKTALEVASGKQQPITVVHPKESRASIVSSSSSSGCPDNDYSTSHSSSSMSSSTRSNECELFSQPASSSGIVCSGNSSDEYEMANGRQNNAQVSPGVGDGPLADDLMTSGKGGRKTAVNSETVLALNDVTTRGECKQQQRKENAGKQRTGGRGSTGKKMIEVTNDDENKSLFPEHVPVSCDCTPIVCFECDCCCDCLEFDEEEEERQGSSPVLQQQTEKLRMRKSPENKFASNIDPVSIYDHLPHPKQITGHKDLKGEPKGYPSSAESREEDREIEDLLNARRPHESFTLEHRSLNSPIGDETKIEKSKWLERRKYMKLFPKFMLPLTTNSAGRGRMLVPRSSSVNGRAERSRLSQSYQNL